METLWRSSVSEEVNYGLCFGDSKLVGLNYGMGEWTIDCHVIILSCKIASLIWHASLVSNIIHSAFCLCMALLSSDRARSYIWWQHLPVVDKVIILHRSIKVPFPQMKPRDYAARPTSSHCWVIPTIRAVASGCEWTKLLLRYREINWKRVA